MTTFVDTSALYALLASDDPNHPAAASWVAALGGPGAERLVTHNYVVLESTALIGARLGRRAVQLLLLELVPKLETTYVDRSLHAAAVTSFLAGRFGHVSLVDRVSFEFMRDQRIPQAFAFDRDFARHGFRTVP